ncbi:hypothetical protein [Catellatospora sp. IY07-71]|uniref:hypothetical protein n=1 Tax=Catellatospora sp. IY07-71 TaxID=2728827 RepID=UPI001BB41BAF|nr:hypothetical protein [Catellatospora sp. IY07-71]
MRTKPMATAGRAVSWSLGAVMTLGALPALGGCDEPRLADGCVVVVDGSGSGRADGGFDVAGELNGSLVKFVRDKGCRMVRFAPIALSSEASPCRGEEVDVDPDYSGGGGVDREDVRNQRRGKALEVALQLLDCLHRQTDQNGSDVLGGLKLAARARPADVPFHVLVVSDFIHADGVEYLNREDLSTEAKRAALIERYASDGRIADLSGASVYGLGFGQLYKTGKAGAFDRFETFWKTLLLDHAHAAQFHVL